MRYVKIKQYIVSYLVGEGEWLREVDERAGESRRAL